MRRAMSVIATGVLVIAVAAVAGAGSPPLRSSHVVHREMLVPHDSAVVRAVQNLSSVYTAQELEEGVYVGSEMCLACHQDQEYQNWRDTNHAQSLRKPMVQYALVQGMGTSCDYDGNGVDDFIQGLDFNQISSGFDAYKPNAPKLSVEDGTYYVTIGDVKMPVVFINGGVGRWRERYAVRIPVTDSPTGYSDDVYFPPIQYNNAPNQWIPYKAGAWWMPDGTPKVHAGMTRAEVASAIKTTFSKNCIGCHTTGIRHLGKTAEGEWEYTPYVATLYRADDPHYFDYDGDGNKDLINVGCEMCHGPGSNHILGGGDPAKILNPAKLDPEQANEICGRCHNRQRSVPNKTYNWPYHDDTDTQWTPATEPLSDFQVNAGEFWPDGVTGYEHNQHYVELLSSAHWNNPFDKLRCFDCHDPHGGSNTAQIVPEIKSDGVTIPTKNENDTLCLACHATHGPFEDITKEMVANYQDNVGAIGAAVAAHSHHPYAPTRLMGLSRCSECHMSSIYNAQRASALHLHNMVVVPPEKTVIYASAEEGMPNACAVSCHSQKVNLWGFGIDPNMQIWNEPFDLDTAGILMNYFGPEGAWWVKEIDQPE